MIIKPATRVADVKEYYFSLKNRELAEINASRKAQGKSPVISLGVGAPDRMPPVEVIGELCDVAQQASAHKYQSYRGIPELRAAFAQWYAKWYGVQLDPETQIQPLTGSKEGILIACLAFLNKGDKVLVPNPGYPTYASAAKMVQAEIVYYDLLPRSGYYPDFDALEAMDLSGVKMMWMNYPNMPTGAAASQQVYEKAVAFGLKHGIMICNDNPYSFVLNSKPLSILAVPRAMECCMELNSLSKAQNMSGWRIGMVGSSADVIAELLKVKSQMDSGMFRALQCAAVKALQQGQDWYDSLNAEYARRKELALAIMERLGAQCSRDSQGLFVWGRLQQDNPLIAGYHTEKTLGERMSDKLLYEYAVFITPGMVFGSNGNDYIRISLCADTVTLTKVLEQLG